MLYYFSNFLYNYIFYSLFVFIYLFILYCFSLHENTVLSIVDARVQCYVRQRHHKVFNNASNTNSPLNSSAKNQNLATVTPNSNNHQQQHHNKRLIKRSNTMYDR